MEEIFDLEFEESDPYTDSYNAVGVDVANSPNGDKAALACGRRNVLCEVQEFYCKNATHLAYNLFMSNEELGQVIIAAMTLQQCKNMMWMPNV